MIKLKKNYFTRLERIVDTLCYRGQRKRAANLLLKADKAAKVRFKKDQFLYRNYKAVVYELAVEVEARLARHFLMVKENNSIDLGDNIFVEGWNCANEKNANNVYDKPFRIQHCLTGQFKELEVQL